MDKLIQTMLVLGLDDWLYAAEARSVVIEAGIENDKIKTSIIAINLLRELIVQQLMVPGDLDHNCKFAPWPLSVEESLNRIEREWNLAGGDPDIGDVCWLNLTPRGEAMAKKLSQKYSN